VIRILTTAVLAVHILNTAITRILEGVAVLCVLNTAVLCVLNNDVQCVLSNFKCRNPALRINKFGEKKSDWAEKSLRFLECRLWSGNPCVLMLWGVSHPSTFLSPPLPHPHTHPLLLPHHTHILQLLGWST
jgi:hypothetical protein